jgi:hypothetical protein
MIQFPANPKKGDRFYQPAGNFFERTWRVWEFTGVAWKMVN